MLAVLNNANTESFKRIIIYLLSCFEDNFDNMKMVALKMDSIIIIIFYLTPTDFQPDKHILENSLI